jgi:hypothetical protein
MPRIALTCLCLALSGCGYNTWWNLPYTSGSNPNFPPGDSENMRRVTGQDVEVPALTPEPGDIWPGPLPPEPTLQELEQQTGEQPQTEQPVPGSPLFDQGRPPSPPAQSPRGSSTPPGSNQPPLAPLPAPQAPQATKPLSPPASPQPGQVVTTPSGPGVTTGGTSGYQTMTVPGGGSAIVVPNGNGTSTVIYPNGKIETVPTPR